MDHIPVPVWNWTPAGGCSRNRYYRICHHNAYNDAEIGKGGREGGREGGERGERNDKRGMEGSWRKRTSAPHT